MKTITLITIILFWGSGIALKSQVQKNPKRFYIEKPNKKNVQLGFKLLNNLIVLPVFVNNSDTLNFILDSGISNTILTDKALADNMKMKYVKEIQMYGFGKANSFMALHSVENEIKIPGIIGQHQDILVIPDPDLDFSKQLGIKIHGLLGYSIFRDFIIELNYETKIINFHAPRTYIYKNRKKETSFPLNIVDTKPILTTQIVQDDSSMVEGRFLIDTGASFALWVDLNSNPAFKLPEKTETLFIGTGLSGPVYGLVGRLKEFGTGTMKLYNPISSFSDSTWAIQPKPLDGRNGTIGADFLSRFNIIFDYRNYKITFRPNTKARDPFKINQSGMEICSPTLGQNIFSISNICQNSPADKAGLKPGDQITHINYHELSKLTLPQVHSMLIEKTGKKLNVGYKRNGKVASTTLIMNDCI